MGIIVLGLILIITGVGSTILYDKYKDQIVSFLSKPSMQSPIRHTTSRQRKPRKSMQVTPSEQDDIQKIIKETRMQLQKIRQEVSAQQSRAHTTTLTAEQQRLKKMFDDLGLK